MAADTRRSRVVLYGGYGPSGGYGNRFRDTWEWNGSVWAQTVSATTPPYLSNHSMAFNTSKGWTLMIGGEIPQSSGPTANRDLYAFDGNDWSLRVLSPRPPWGLRAPLAYDSARARIVYLVSGQTWEYTAPPQIAASWQGFGQGCVGSSGVPALAPAPGQLPWLGKPFVTRIDNVPLGMLRIPFGLLGASKSTWNGLSLPFDLTAIGMAGCTLYTGAEVTVTLPASAGVATWNITIPPDVVLVGALVYQQAFVLDAGANPLGATTSNAGELKIGLL